MWFITNSHRCNFSIHEFTRRMWMTGSINPAYEHFVTNLIRQKLIVAIDGQHISATCFTEEVSVVLPEGEEHEIGLLFVNYIFRAAGYHTLYFGQSLPINNLARVKEKYNPDIVFTSMTTQIPVAVARVLFTRWKLFSFSWFINYR